MADAEIDLRDLRCTDVVCRGNRRGVVTSAKGGTIKIAWDEDDFVSVYDSAEALHTLVGATLRRKASAILHGDAIYNDLSRARSRRR